VIEASRVGGTCVIRGCVPKKLLVLASRFSDEFALAASFGWSVGATRFDWPALIAAKNREIGRLEGIYRRNLEAAGVVPVDTRAVLEDGHTVRLLASGERVQAEKILIATGGRPFRPDVPGAELAITSNEVFDLPAGEDDHEVRGHPGESLQEFPAHRVDSCRVAILHDGGEGAVEVEDPEGAGTGIDRFGWPPLHAATPSGEIF